MTSSGALSRIDLHIHTTCSDGTFTPEAAIRESSRLGMRMVAIADHDITDGVAPALAAAPPGLTVVPAVEINTDYEAGEVHLLGYWIDLEHQGLQQELARIRNARLERSRHILQKLAGVGCRISEQRVREIAGEGSVGRPHIAAAMVEAGYVRTISEAFDRFIGRRGVAYVERYRITPEEAVGYLQGAGGIPVLAHPVKVKRPGLIERLIPAGLRGIEAFHSDHTSADAASYVALAQRLGLLVTGGTDSHGPHSDRPVAIGSVPVPDWVGDTLLQARPSRR